MTVPHVNVSFPVGDTSVIVIDGDDLRAWLCYQRLHSADNKTFAQQQAFNQALDLVADLVGLDDYIEDNTP